MSDKMMRMASRGIDGLAKAIKSDEDGELIMRLSSGDEKTLHNGSNSAGNGQTLDATGYATVAIQVIGSFEGELRVLGAVRGGAYSYLKSTKSSERVPKSRITTPGVYFVDAVGIANMQVRVTNLNSGSVTVYAKTDTIPYVVRDTKNVGITNKSYSGEVAHGETVQVFSYGDNVNVTLNYLEMTTDSPTSIFLNLRGRDKDSNYSDSVYQTKIAKLDGGGLLDLSVENLFDNKSGLWEVLHYDTVNNEYKIALKESINLPNGVVLEIKNTSNSSRNASVFCILEQHN